MDKFIAGITSKCDLGVSLSDSVYTSHIGMPLTAEFLQG